MENQIQDPITPTPPPQPAAPAVSPVFPKKNNSDTSGTNTKCKACTGASDPGCINNTSCFTPAGESKGVCVPIVKTSEVYTNDQINQICGTEFGNDPTAYSTTHSTHALTGTTKQ